MDTTVTTEQQSAEQKEAAFWAEIDRRKEAIENATTPKKQVFSIVLIDIANNGEYVVGFARVPDMITQMRLIDKSAGNPNGFSMEACSIALEELLIKSETDERITDKQDLNYWKGACMSMAQFMTAAIPVIKKK